jgi:hypothetical protein
VDTTIAELKRAAIKTIAGTTPIVAGVTMVARPATYTTVRERRRNLSKGTETKCEAGAAVRINGKTRVPAGSAATTVADKRGAMNREVRPAMAGAVAVAAVVLAEVAGAVAVAGAAVAVAGAGAGKEQCFTWA